MEFPFPPAPPGYGYVIAARVVLAAWSVASFAILVIRLRRRKFVRTIEFKWWLDAAGLSIVIAAFGYCPYHVWDNNKWLVPLITAALGISVVGCLICSLKWQLEANSHELKWMFRIMAILVVSAFGGLILFSTAFVTNPRSHPKLECMSNIRQVGIGLINDSSLRNGTLPPASSGLVPVSWRVSILGQLDWISVLRQYDQTVPWNQAPNDKLAMISKPIYSCPANYFPKDAQGRWYTAYSMPTGPGTVGANPGGTKIDDITDGATFTLLVVECSGSQIVWTEPRDVDVTTQPTGINLKGNKPGHSAGWLSSYHRGGVNVVMADGSVRFLSDKTAPTVLKKLATFDGGEEIRPRNDLP
jgi:prepilin-type processing-associated H-X9-DG protein